MEKMFIQKDMNDKLFSEQQHEVYRPKMDLQNEFTQPIESIKFLSEDIQN